MNQVKATRCRSVVRVKDYHAWRDCLPRDTLNLSDTQSARVRILYESTFRLAAVPFLRETKFAGDFIRGEIGLA
jgi:hypothetical protein